MKTKITYAAFGQKLEAARVLLGVNQFDIANSVKVKQQTVSRWEQGASRPSLNTLKDLIQLLKVKETEIDEWFHLVGYNLTIEVPTIAPSRSAPLPLANLHHEDFERFMCYLLGYLYPKAAVNRFGGAGHSQDGLDIKIHFNDGVYWDFQCKRHKKFGPQKAKDAIEKYKHSAEKKFIVISRVATPDVRQTILNSPGWTLWDVEDISTKFRELSRDEQRRLVDIFSRATICAVRH